MEHHVFLSYSRDDLSIMKRIKKDLMNRGLSIWTDENLEPGTHSWKLAIQTAIENSGCFVVLLSPEAKKSEWVDREIEYARVQNVRIFPVLIRGTEASSVPFEVVATQRIELTSDEDYQVGLEALYDTTAKHLGLRRQPMGHVINEALFELGAKLPKAQKLTLVNNDGLAQGWADLDENIEINQNQIAAMMSTLVGLADRTGHRLNISKLKYTISAFEGGCIICVPIEKQSLVILFSEFISVDATLMSIQRAIPNLLKTLNLTIDVKF